MDKRQFNRINFQTNASLHAQNTILETRLLDLSLKGALINCPVGFVSQPNHSISLTFSLDGIDKPITLTGTVAHQDNQHIGIAVQNVDIDSATLLRNLVAFNLGDDSLLQRDLKSLSAD